MILLRRAAVNPGWGNALIWKSHGRSATTAIPWLVINGKTAKRIAVPRRKGATQVSTFKFEQFAATRRISSFEPAPDGNSVYFVADISGQ